jgi:hypothetical protein
MAVAAVNAFVLPQIETSASTRRNHGKSSPSVHASQEVKKTTTQVDMWHIAILVRVSTLVSRLNALGF